MSFESSCFPRCLSSSDFVVLKITNPQSTLKDKRKNPSGGWSRQHEPLGYTGFHLQGADDGGFAHDSQAAQHLVTALVVVVPRCLVLFRVVSCCLVFFRVGAVSVPCCSYFPGFSGVGGRANPRAIPSLPNSSWRGRRLQIAGGLRTRKDH